MVVLAVMVAISVVGRLIFAVLPGFKRYSDCGDRCYLYGFGIRIFNRIAVSYYFKYVLWAGALDAFSDACLGKPGADCGAAGDAENFEEQRNFGSIRVPGGIWIFSHYGHMDGAFI